MDSILSGGGKTSLQPGALLGGPSCAQLFVRSFTRSCVVTDAFSVAGGSLGPGHAEPKGAGAVLLEQTVEGWCRAGRLHRPPQFT